MAEGERGAPSGWFADPFGRFDGRYWDGARWSDRVRLRSGDEEVDPPGNRPGSRFEERPRFDGANSQIGTTYAPAKSPTGLRWLNVALSVGVTALGAALIVSGFDTKTIGIGSVGAGFIFVLIGGLLFKLCVDILRHPPVVTVTSHGLETSNSYGSHRYIPTSDIADISQRSRTYGRSIVSMSVPYVTVKDGSGLWLDAMAVRTESKPEVEAQGSAIRRICQNLGVPATSA